MTREEIQGARHETYWHIFFFCLLVVPYFFVASALVSNFTFWQAASGLFIIYIVARAIEINGYAGGWQYSLADLIHDFLRGVIYIGFISYIAFIFQDEMKNIRISIQSDWRLFVVFCLSIIIIMAYFENKIHPAPHHYHTYPKGEETKHYDRHGNYTVSSYREKKDK